MVNFLLSPAIKHSAIFLHFLFCIKRYVYLIIYERFKNKVKKLKLEVEVLTNWYVANGLVQERRGLSERHKVQVKKIPTGLLVHVLYSGPQVQSERSTKAFLTGVSHHWLAHRS